MEHVNKILKNRAIYAEMIALRADRYLDIIESIIIGINRDEYDKSQQNVDLIMEFLTSLGIEDIRKPKPKKPGMEPKPAVSYLPAIEITGPILKSDPQFLAYLSNLYVRLRLVDSALESVVILMQNTTYAQLAVQNMSSTYTTNIYHERNVAIVSLEKYKDASMTDDVEIFKMIEAPVDKIYEFIISNPLEINKLTTRLIAMGIANLSGDRKSALEILVEKQKDHLLGVGRVKLDYSGSQGLLIRYNLRPITQSQPIEQILETLGRKTLEDGVPTIIITNVTKSPIEFNIRALIDTEYIIKNDLKTNPINGLNKKIVRRFETTRVLKSDDSASKPIQIIGAGEYYHVLESIDGITYRILTIDGSGPYLVPKTQILGLIEGVTNRCHRYNQIQAGEILKKCHDAQAEFILAEYEKLKPESSLPIKDLVMEKLMKLFSGRVREIKSFDDLSYVNRDEINDILLKILIHTEGVKNTGATEYTMTYVTKFESIVSAFVKELERRWQQESISNRIFRENLPDELVKILTQIYHSVIEAAVDEMDNSNTWTDYDLTLKEYFIRRKQVVV